MYVNTVNTVVPAPAVSAQARSPKSGLILLDPPCQARATGFGHRHPVVVAVSVRQFRFTVVVICPVRMFVRCWVLLDAGYEAG